MPKISEINNTGPVIEFFEIKGLNGYKNLRLETPTCVRVVVAENGTGKTTLLNALYAVLSKKIYKLREINFESIVIKFSGNDVFEIKKEDVFSASSKLEGTDGLPEILSYGVSEEEFYDLYVSMGAEFNSKVARSSEVFKKIYQVGPYDRDTSLSLLKRAMSSPRIAKIHNDFFKYINNALGDLEVMYLPTFRRIEVEHAGFRRGASPQRGFFDSEADVVDSDDDNLMWFGMGDVQAQLDRIKERIRSDTFNAYARLSVQSLEDLLSPVSKKPDPIPSDNKILGSQLKLVLARLGQAEGSSGAKIWELIGSGEINNSTYDNLRSYLFQMLEIYTSTQKDEQSIEGFVQVINNYWIMAAKDSKSKVEKDFVFDKMSLDIDIKTPYSREPLRLKNLSSGEKQIVSIFAKLYLRNDKKFIVLIDEPELSLSMVWQRLFLPDILESPSCTQLIAITHSPFVFENALDDFAQPLFVTYPGAENVT